MHSYNYQRNGSSAKDNDYRRYNTSYGNLVSGNNVRKYEVYEEPEVDDKEWLKEIYRNRDIEKAREERARKSRKRRLEQSKSINFTAFAVLAGVVIMLVYLCFGYIKARSSVTSLNKQIIQQETEYNTLKAKNDSNVKEIESSVDLRKIYRIATKDLGMVFANNNQVVTYDDSESAYVRQYEDIQDKYGDNVWDDIANAVK